MRAVYYLNQFFGQIGGEEAADHPTEIQKEERLELRVLSRRDSAKKNWRLPLRSSVGTIILRSIQKKFWKK